MKAAEGFLADFVTPLVAGGHLLIGGPLGRAGLHRFGGAELPASASAMIDDARARVAASLLLDPAPPLFDRDALRLALAVHDLLFLSHPRAGDLGVRGRLPLVAECAQSLATLEPTRAPDELVARHSLLHLLPTLSRTDVRVSFWVGKREFHGEEPPRMLTAWPNVRRVHEERWHVACFGEAASHPLGGPVVRALLDASPLTDLLHPVRIDPRFDLGRHAALLSLPSIARAVAYAWLEDLDHVAGALAQAALAELEEAPPEVRDPVLALFSHLHLCLVLGRPHEGRGDPRDRRAGPASPQRFTVGGDPAQRDFYGLFAALSRAAPELSAPADVRGDPRFAAALAEHTAACAATCGPSRTAELERLVARKLGKPIELSDAPPLPGAA
jgi:hypothetical protein